MKAPNTIDSRISSLLRKANSGKNIHPEIRATIAEEGLDKVMLLAEYFKAWVNAEFAKNDVSYRREMGRHGLLLKFIEGEDVGKLRAEAISIGGPKRDTSNWINMAISEGARYYDATFRRQNPDFLAIQQPEPGNGLDAGFATGTQEDDNFTYSMTPLSFEQVVLPSEFIDLNQRIRDLYHGNHIPSPIITQGMLVLFEQEVPSSNVSDRAIQDTVHTVASEIYKRILRVAEPSEELMRAFKITSELVLDSSMIERNVTIVSDYARRIESYFDSFEQAKQYVETQVAIAITRLYGHKSKREHAKL